MTETERHYQLGAFIVRHQDDPRPQNTLAWAYTLRHLYQLPSIVFSCSFLPASKDWRHGQGASWAILVDELLEGERDG